MGVQIGLPLGNAYSTHPIIENIASFVYAIFSTTTGIQHAKYQCPTRIILAFSTA